MARDETYHQANQALGSTIQLTIVTAKGQVYAEKILKTLWKQVFEFEKRCSRFIASSELSRLNESAGIVFVASEELLNIVTRAREIGLRTGGLFNPFVLPDLQRAGYSHSLAPAYTSVPAPNYLGRSVAPLETLEIGDGWIRIPYGSAIDLGGCGKGYIGDKLADQLDATEGIAGYWVSIGGDVIAQGTHETGASQSIAIVSSGTDRAILAQIPVPAEKRIAVATSTTQKRKGVHKGKAWHHIIDPRTGKPTANNIRLASVVGESLFDADVHAANVIIAGDSEARNYCISQDLSLVLVEHGDQTAGARGVEWLGTSNLAMDETKHNRYDTQ